MSILDWVKLLSSLSEAEKENLALFCQEKQLLAWEVLFNEEEEASAMYILKEWNIEISRNSEWEKVVLWEVHAEEILWEMALFWDTNKRMATATALKESTLIVILSFSIKELTSKHPELMDKIKTIINDRMIVNKNK
jgi:CRP/FNR family cyclic AMP-dependent transcriptional regulator